MNLLNVLEELEAAPQGGARLEVLRKGDSQELRDYLVQALSPQITFGIKQLPEPASSDGDQFDDASWYQVLMRILRRLRLRELTGNEAKETIAGFLGACTETQKKWSQRVLRQDLRVNVGAKEVNKVLGDGTVFQFGVALAEDYQKVDPKHYPGRWFVQPKLDGARCVAYFPAHGGPVALYSRTGKLYRNFESVRIKLQEVNEFLDAGQDLYVDGEVVSYVDGHVDFQALQHTLFRKDGQETGSLKFLAFDAASGEDWQKQEKTYENRYRALRVLVERVILKVPGTVTRFGIVESFITENPTKESMKTYGLGYAQKGYEGAMLPRADVPVRLKRTRDLLKVKSFDDAEAAVTGTVEGQGKYAGALGALICQTADGKVFEIGSGFTDAQRQQYWNERESLPTQVTYKYQELTEDNIPRFPIFKGFRSDNDNGN